MDGQCATLICDVDINVNWWGVVVVIPTALAIALVARMWSGSFKSPFAGHRPATWFLLVFFLPPVGVALFCVGAVKQLKAARRPQVGPELHL